jgi:dienelactone hydrolase
MGFGPYLFGYYDVERLLPEYLMAKARLLFEEEEKEKQSIKSIGAFEVRRKKIREHFLDAIGGLPDQRGPLNPICTGVVAGHGYIIEKITFQSMEGVYVTSNLYIPEDLQGPAPGVLLVCGHAREAKASLKYQMVALDLVACGFVVLVIDPPGQGERMGYYDPITKKEMIRWGTFEHSYAGYQATLAGSKIARYFIWDGIRAMDYLLTREEVDPERLGVTGNSGGGTQTSYLMMIDDRIRAAVPCCYITSREEYMKTGQAHDAEQNIYGAIAAGLNYDDFITSFAPKPVMIGAMDSDFFCIEGTLASYERAKAIYSLYGKGENVALVVGKGTHQYHPTLREAAVNWFLYHLKGREPDFKLVERKVHGEEELWCTKEGQVNAEFPDSRGVYHLNLEYARRSKPERKPIDSPAKLGQFRQEMRLSLSKILGLPPIDASFNLYPRIIREEEKDGLLMKYLFFRSEEGIIVSGVIVEAPDLSPQEATPCIMLFEDGTEDLEREWSGISAAVNECGCVMIFDPRGVGAVRSRKINPRDHMGIYGTEFKLSYDSLMMGTSLMGLRTYDVIKAHSFLKDYTDNGNRISIMGRGIAAIYGLFASVFLDEGPSSLILEEMLYSFWDVVRQRYFHMDNRMIIHGVVSELDIVDLLAAVDTPEVRLIRPLDGKGEPIGHRVFKEEILQIFSDYYELSNPPLMKP